MQWRFLLKDPKITSVVSRKLVKIFRVISWEILCRTQLEVNFKERILRIIIRMVL
jgi:hypothetical protein